MAASAFYAWLAKKNRPMSGFEVVLVAEIRQIFEASGATYGSPRVHAELAARVHKISRKRVERLMRDNGLAVPKRRKRKPFTTDSEHDLPVSPNLLAQKFEVATPDRVWLADITYVPTDEGWLYLAGIKDMATREIVRPPRPAGRAPFGKRMIRLLPDHGRWKTSCVPNYASVL